MNLPVNKMFIFSKMRMWFLLANGDVMGYGIHAFIVAKLDINFEK